MGVPAIFGALLEEFEGFWWFRVYGFQIRV